MTTVQDGANLRNSHYPDCLDDAYKRYCVSDRQEYEPHHLLDHIIDAPVGLVRDEFGIAVMNGNELAEQAFEAEVYDRAMQRIADKK